ncbi:serine carboxypeptidase domain-containing protein [Sarocladium implicatum]|nr:serine carboxypeptidase domain-containing protein [Sarocladium implicatum]
MRFPLILAPLAFGSTVLAQAFVPPPQGLTEVFSEKFPGANITYKEVNGICETTKGVKSYSGYVHLPKDFIPDAKSWSADVDGHLYFWYFEARKNKESAPTAIYMGGGPGYTTFDASAVFPCYFNSDGNSTTLNEHSWNTDTNMLFIEQPLGVGFSYTSLANGTVELMAEELDFKPLKDGEDLPELNMTYRQATMNDKTAETMTSTTMAVARTLWRFAQVFFNDFPEWQTKNDKISVWAVSYGGLYAPIFGSYIVDQNALIEDKSHELKNATKLNLGTVGVLNGVIDVRAMVLGFPDFAQNNTYGVQVWDDKRVQLGVEQVTKKGGCYDVVDQCRALAAKDDPEAIGDNKKVNQICALTTAQCGPLVQAWIEQYSTVTQFDITQEKPAALPYEYNTAFFNQPWVQAALGVPLNYTRQAPGVEGAFLMKKGDMGRYNTSHLSNLLDNDVNVALLYGDLDFRCNWFSGENASLQIEYADKAAFADAGYATIQTNSSYEGGLVREVGKLSFSRVFLAGHSTGGYQPETVAKIFYRAMFGKDVATGEINLAEQDSYATKGPKNVRNVKKDKPELVENVCYVHYPLIRCTSEQLEALKSGEAETHNFLVTSPGGTKNLTADKAKAGGSGGNASGGDGDGNGDGGSEEGSGDGDEDDEDGGLTVTAITVSTVLVIVTALFVACFNAKRTPNRGKTPSGRSLQNKNKGDAAAAAAVTSGDVKKKK